MLPIINNQTSPYVSNESKSPDDKELDRLVHNEIRMMNRFFERNEIDKVVDEQKRLECKYTDLIAMNSRYKDENIFYAEYIDRTTKYQIFSFEGKLYDSEGFPVSTSSLNFDTGAILVMDQRGNLFLAHKKRGEIHHSTFLAGGAVAYAGMVEVVDGIIVQEKVWSGHYTPEPSQQMRFHERLSKNFIQMVDERNSFKHFIRSSFLKDRSSELEKKRLCSICSRILSKNTSLPYEHKFDRETTFKIRAAIFISEHSNLKMTKHNLVQAEANVFETMEKIRDIVVKKYMDLNSLTQRPYVVSVTIRGSLKFYAGKTASDYEVMPGEESLMWVTLL